MLKLRKIRWKEHVQIEEVRHTENELHKLGMNAVTSYKIFFDDLWITYVKPKNVSP
jgi:hypothetical protein